MSEPKYQDVVKHKSAGVSGTVIAKYPGSDDNNKIRQYLDVRSNGHVYWETPAENWETVIEYSQN